MSGDRPSVAAVDWFVLKLPASYRFSDRPAVERLPGTDYYFEPEWDQVYSTRLESLLVRVETSDGYHGWGEAQAPIVPEAPATVLDRLLGPMVVGETLEDVPRLRDEMYRTMNVRGHYQGFMVDAVAALDTALWDALGRSRSRPVHSLLGGTRRDTLPAYVSLPGFEREEQVRQAERFVDDGFAGVKAFGGAGVAADIGTATAIREALGDEPTIALDAFWSYTADEAVSLASQLTTHSLAFLEAPLRPEDIDGHARVRDAAGISIAAGEPIRTRFEFARWFDADAVDVAQPDFLRTGLTEGNRIAGLASENGVPIAPHFGASTVVGMAASWNLAATLDDLVFQEHQPRCFEVTNEFLEGGLSCEDGTLRVPGGPGLGINVDEEAISEHVVSSGRVDRSVPEN